MGGISSGRYYWAGNRDGVNARVERSLVVVNRDIGVSYRGLAVSVEYMSIVKVVASAAAAI